jgi:hypothetical protein
MILVFNTAPSYGVTAIELKEKTLMARNEKTSKEVGKIAAKGLKDPGSLTNKDIQKLSGSVLTQRPDKKR